MNRPIVGFTFYPLRRISQPLGDVLRGLRVDDEGFYGFGEAYFSIVHEGATKGWKRHHRMAANLIVPVGRVRVLCFDDRAESPSRGEMASVEISRENYGRLCIEPNLWFAIQGLEPENVVLNIASVLHDPAEGETRPTDDPRMPQLPSG